MRAFFLRLYDVYQFTLQFWKEVFLPPYEVNEVFNQFFEVGIRSLSIITLTGFITGLVFTKQSRSSLAEFGATSWLPSLMAIALLRALAPLVTALIVAGKVGSNIGAEIGSMRVTEQIDAMEVSAINPYRYLVVTRVLATTLMVPLLAIFADAIALLGGYIAMNIHDATTIHHFFIVAMAHLEFIDIFPAIVKTFFFGFVVGIIGCYKGYNASRGTESVGIAANSAVVAASLGVFIIDLIAAQITDLL